MSARSFDCTYTSSKPLNIAFTGPSSLDSLCVSCIWVTSVVFLIISGHNLSFLTLFPDHWSLGPGPGQSCRRSPGPGPTSALVTGSGPPPEWSRDRLHRPFGYRNLFPGASPSDRVWAECHIWIVASDVSQLIRTIIKTYHHHLNITLITLTKYP